VRGARLIRGRRPGSGLAPRTPLARLALPMALAALACALAGGAWADEEISPASGGALAVQADPPRLVLGRDAGADLRIAAPPEVEELSVTCSAGKVENVRRLPGGGFTAHYRAPPERYPQVAIVSAVGRGASPAVDGWLAIPLFGQGDARVPGEPGSTVTLRIGAESFGPVRVAEDGYALVPVVVPPGLREGHLGFHALDLLVPETSLIHAALDRQAVLADRVEVLRLWVYEVAPHGTSRPGDPPVVEVSRGTVALHPREAGAWEGTWTLPGGPPGEARLTVRVDGLPASREVLKVAMAPGPAAAVSLAVDRTTLVAGQADEAQVTARGYDAAGNPSAGPIVLSADAGTLTRPEEAGPGEVRATLRVPPRHAGRGQVQVEARAGGTSAARTVALRPGPAARMILGPDGSSMRADGRTEAVLSLEVTDRFDNPVAEAPRLQATWGPPPALEPAGPGCWTVRYRPPAADERRTVHLTATLEEAYADAGLLLLPSPDRQVSLLAAGGGLAALRGGVAGGQLLLGAELPAPEVLSPRPDAAAAWRLELVGLAAGGGDERRLAAAILAGPTLKGGVPALRLYTSGTAGVLLDRAETRSGSGRAGVGVAGRVAAGAVLPRRGAAPFLDLALFFGSASPTGPFGALQLSLGLRFDLYRDADAPRE